MKTLLTTEDLEVTRNGRTLCEQLNMVIQPGDCWGILGANGRGKTTLLHTLFGFHPQSKGKIFLQQKDLTYYSLKTAAQKKGILFQHTTFTFPQTVFEYCLSGRYPHRSLFNTDAEKDYSLTQESLLKMDLLHLRNNLIQNLSGGEQRRLSIATLLAQQPLLYFLDEPTHHLDIKHQIKALDQITCAAQKLDGACIMTLHDINLAQRYCNNILFLLGEKDFLLGKTQDVLNTENLSRTYGVSVRAIADAGKNIWVMENDMC